MIEALTYEMVIVCALAFAIIFFVMFRSGSMTVSSEVFKFFFRITVGDKKQESPANDRLSKK